MLRLAEVSWFDSHVDCSLCEIGNFVAAKFTNLHVGERCGV